MKYVFRKENNDVQEVIQEVNSISESTFKKNTVKIILSVVLVLIVGIASGFYILKGLNSGVKQNSFMYNILSSSGLLLSENKQVEDVISDDLASDSNFANRLTFIQEKDGCSYYYYITDEGDYLYYYSYTKDIYNYYASDSNGESINDTYNDPEEPVTYTVPDFTKMTVEEVQDNYWGPDSYVEILYVPNGNYPENAIYYQSIKAGEDIYNGNYGTIIVNKSEQ